ncbi:MAG: hypothetical protein IJM20_03430 [Clostridia bacterium]|jgi:hypothetical protein|nr:hypothetical protein [Clostridia bacterium]
MKNSFKKAIIIAVCAVLTFSAVAPSLALTKSEVYSQIEYGIGVRVTCNSGVSSLGGSAEIILSFESGVNHMLEEDYSCRAKVTLTYVDNYSHLSDTYHVNAMTASATRSKMSGNIISSAYCEYWANYDPVHDVTLH